MVLREILRVHRYSTRFNLWSILDLDSGYKVNLRRPHNYFVLIGLNIEETPWLSRICRHAAGGSPICPWLLLFNTKPYTKLIRSLFLVSKKYITALLIKILRSRRGKAVCDLLMRERRIPTQTTRQLILWRMPGSCGGRSLLFMLVITRTAHSYNSCVNERINPPATVTGKHDYPRHANHIPN